MHFESRSSNLWNKPKFIIVRFLFTRNKVTTVSIFHVSEYINGSRSISIFSICLVINSNFPWLCRAVIKRSNSRSIDVSANYPSRTPAITIQIRDVLSTLIVEHRIERVAAFIGENRWDCVPPLRGASTPVGGRFIPPWPCNCREKKLRLGIVLAGNAVSSAAVLAPTIKGWNRWFGSINFLRLSVLPVPLTDIEYHRRGLIGSAGWETIPWKISFGDRWSF